MSAFPREGRHGAPGVCVLYSCNIQCCSTPAAALMCPACCQGLCNYTGLHPQGRMLRGLCMATASAGTRSGAVRTGLSQKPGSGSASLPCCNQDKVPRAGRMALPAGNDYHLLYLMKLGRLFLWPILIFFFFWTVA